MSYYNKGIFNSTIIISTCFVGIITQMLFALAYRAPLNSVYSAIVTSLLLIIIVRSNFNFIYCLAILFAIASKFLIRIDNRQFFNPAVFGLMTIFLLMGNSQFLIPDIPLYLTIIFVFINLLLLMLNKVLKIHAFITYIIPTILYFYLFSSDDLNKFQSIFLMSSFFLLDRSSLPNSNTSKIIMGILIFFFQIKLNQFYSIELSFILSIFLVSILTPIFNIILRSPSFYWNGTNIRILNEG